MDTHSSNPTLQLTQLALGLSRSEYRGSWVGAGGWSSTAASNPTTSVWSNVWSWLPPAQWRAPGKLCFLLSAASVCCFKTYHTRQTHCCNSTETISCTGWPTYREKWGTANHGEVLSPHCNVKTKSTAGQMRLGVLAKDRCISVLQLL